MTTLTIDCDIVSRDPCEVFNFADPPFSLYSPLKQAITLLLYCYYNSPGSPLPFLPYFSFILSLPSCVYSNTDVSPIILIIKSRFFSKNSKEPISKSILETNSSQNQLEKGAYLKISFEDLMKVKECL